MDYLNTQLDFKKMKRALNRPSATEKQKQSFLEIEKGYSAMTDEYLKFLEKSKESIFRLFKRRMTASCSPAYRLGIMMALKEQGILFQIRNQGKMEEKMRLQQRHEHRKMAMEKVSLQQNQL